MMRCSKCLGQGSTDSRWSCSSCRWRVARRQLLAVPVGHIQDEVLPTLLSRLQTQAEAVSRITLLAMMLGEQGSLTAHRTGAALHHGDQTAYDAELLRLARQLLLRIEEF